MTRRQIISAVKRALSRVGHDIEFDVVNAGVRADGDWWYVPVVSQRHGKDVRRDATASIFANVESRLHNDLDVEVLLIPVVE